MVKNNWLDNAGSTRNIVITATIAALYYIFTIMLAPLSYGPIQIRLACALYSLALYNPIYSFGFGLGVFLANLSSPFGIFDFAIMPFVSMFAAFVCYKARRLPILAIGLQALIISVGVCVFPLGIGGQVPFYLSFPGVFISQLIVIYGGWIIFRNTKLQQMY